MWGGTQTRTDAIGWPITQKCFSVCRLVSFLIGYVVLRQQHSGKRRDNIVRIRVKGKRETTVFDNRCVFHISYPVVEFEALTF